MAGLTQGKLINTAPLASARLMNRLRREQMIREFGLKTAECQRCDPHHSLPEIEFNFPDEDRDFFLSSLCRCPLCKSVPILSRTMGREVSGDSRREQFRVICPNKSCPSMMTAWCRSSVEAVRTWRMMVALIKE